MVPRRDRRFIEPPPLEYRFRESCHKQGIHLSFQAPMCAGGIEDEGLKAMAAWRRAIELSLGDADVEGLRSIAQSRTEPASRVERARILLAYREDPSFFALGRALGLHHQTVQRCVERAVVEGPMAALDDRPRPGKEPTITIEAKAWLTSLACRKAKELGYPHELWTTRLLARHAREHGPAEGHACLANLAHGTVSLLAGIDLLTGKVHALVKDRHRSREFIEFLKLVDAAYPADTAIHLILDNHSAHISRETRAWLAEQPAGRFEFTFTPTYGSWLNLVEGFFSKLARSVLRHIRVSSKQELKERLMAAVDYFNRDPVVHTWTYKLDKAA